MARGFFESLLTAIFLATPSNINPSIGWFDRMDIDSCMGGLWRAEYFWPATDGTHLSTPILVWDV
jgi:hypothetical protein